jgi:hypothetical protein
MTVQEMARTMLMDSKLTDIFWTQAVHTTIHIQNRVMLRNNTDKTPYELWKGRPTNVKHFRVFGRKCYIKREDGRMGKFDSRVDKGVLVGYSSTRKSYKCYNLRLNKVVESINVTIDETGRQELKEEENESMEQLYEEEAEDEKEVEGEDEEDLTEEKSKFNKCLQRHLADEYRRIILQIRLSETKMQELRLEEELFTRTNTPSTLIYD